MMTYAAPRDCPTFWASAMSSTPCDSTFASWRAASTCCRGSTRIEDSSRRRVMSRSVTTWLVPLHPCTRSSKSTTATTLRASCAKPCVAAHSTTASTHAISPRLITIPPVLLRRAVRRPAARACFGRPTRALGLLSARRHREHDVGAVVVVVDGRRLSAAFVRDDSPGQPGLRTDVDRVLAAVRGADVGVNGRALDVRVGAARDVDGARSLAHGLVWIRDRKRLPGRCDGAPPSGRRSRHVDLRGGLAACADHLHVAVRRMSGRVKAVRRGDLYDGRLVRFERKLHAIPRQREQLLEG